MTDFACTQCEVLDGRYVCHVCDKVETPSFAKRVSSKIFHSVYFFLVSFTYFFRPKTYWAQFSGGKFRFIDFLDNILIAVGVETACVSLWSDFLNDPDKTTAVGNAVKTALSRISAGDPAKIDTSYLSYLYGALYEFRNHLILSLFMLVGLLLVALPMAVPSLVLFNRNKETRFFPYVAAIAFLNALTGVFAVVCVTILQMLLWNHYPQTAKEANQLALWPQLAVSLVFLIGITGLNKVAFKTNIVIAFLAALLSVAVGIGIGVGFGVLQAMATAAAATAAAAKG